MNVYVGSGVVIKRGYRQRDERRTDGRANVMRRYGHNRENATFRYDTAEVENWLI